MFQQQAEQELFETVKAFHACKQEEGQSVSTYVLKMKAYLDQMERLGYPIPLVLGVNLILTSLSKDYDQKGYTQEKSCCPRYKERHKIPPPAKKEDPAKDTERHHCHKTGHWKRNCPLYLVELKKNKASESGTSGYQKLNKGALDLYVGNGNTASVKAIGSYELIVHSGMILVLDNYNGAISVSKDDIFYFNAFPRDGIFEIDMHNHISNECLIYTCSNKKS
ncbi:hypothetical protein Tco_0810061, partial [Tanacetum coccineum]